MTPALFIFIWFVVLIFALVLILSCLPQDLKAAEARRASEEAEAPKAVEGAAGQSSRAAEARKSDEDTRPRNPRRLTPRLSYLLRSSLGFGFWTLTLYRKTKLTASS